MSGRDIYVGAALFAGEVIEDKQGLYSLIRVYDEVHAEMAPDTPEPSAGQPVTIPLVGLVSLRTGSAYGRHTVRLDLVAPDGERKDGQPFDLAIEEGSTGINIPLNIRFRAKGAGRYWFEVLVDGELLTRIPMTVVLGSVDEII